MASKLITTHELTGVRVVGGKNGTKRIGKVRRFVFHPKEKRCVGFIVKRPDLLWMFRRKDKFVSIEGYDIVDGRIAIRNVPEATDRAACKALGVNWDDCVLWVGLPVMTEDGTSLGMVGNVTFNRITGMVDTFDTDSGATANALLGKRTIPAALVKGFRRGMGAALAQVAVTASLMVALSPISWSHHNVLLPLLAAVFIMDAFPTYFAVQPAWLRVTATVFAVVAVLGLYLSPIRIASWFHGSADGLEQLAPGALAVSAIPAFCLWVTMTLWSIAAEQMGEGTDASTIYDYTLDIYEANKDALGQNAELLYEGQVLQIPEQPVH